MQVYLFYFFMHFKSRFPQKKFNNIDYGSKSDKYFIINVTFKTLLVTQISTNHLQIIFSVKTLDYKSSAIGKVKLKTAWKRGSLPKPTILKGHVQSISMIRMSGDLLATVSWEKNVKIWNKLSSKPRQMFLNI